MPVFTSVAACAWIGLPPQHHNFIAIQWSLLRRFFGCVHLTQNSAIKRRKRFWTIMNASNWDDCQQKMCHPFVDPHIGRIITIWVPTSKDEVATMTRTENPSFRNPKNKKDLPIIETQSGRRVLHRHPSHFELLGTQECCEALTTMNGCSDSPIEVNSQPVISIHKPSRRLRSAGTAWVLSYLAVYHQKARDVRHNISRRRRSVNLKKP